MAVSAHRISILQAGMHASMLKGQEPCFAHPVLLVHMPLHTGTSSLLAGLHCHCVL